MKKIASMLPERTKKFLRKLRTLYYNGDAKFCPICGKSSSRFSQFGLVPRKDAACLHCGALERHRLLWLFLSERTNFFNGEKKRMLHVAPEPNLETRFRDVVGHGYLTADLHNPNAMVKMDITDIQYPDQTFDLIYCSHVLEHVLEDIKAMRELHRVLKSDGWAILLVPIGCEKTYEDQSIVDPEKRLKAFGQADHVRIYGSDYVDRLQEAGFAVSTIRASDLVKDDQVVRMGLTRASGDIFYCTK